MKKAKQEPVRIPYKPAKGAGPVEIELARLGIPLTRKNWLAMNHMFDEIPDPYPAELEAQMPRSIQTKEFRGD